MNFITLTEAARRALELEAVFCEALSAELSKETIDKVVLDFSVLLLSVKGCCEEHSFIPVGSTDWETIHLRMSNMVVNLTELALRPSAMVLNPFTRVQAVSLSTLLQCHHDLMSKGVGAKPIADAYYETLLAHVEEFIDSGGEVSHVH